MPAKAPPKRKPVTTADGLTVFCGHSRLADPAKLKQHPENTRRHPEAQLALLAEIIRGNGWRETITVSKRSGRITRGHARVMAALAQGWKQVPVDDQAYASEESELADLIADTRIKEFSNLSDDKLRTLIVRMKENDGDLRLTALDTNIIDNILREYEQSIRLAMINPEADGTGGDTIRQAILVFDESQYQRFAAAVAKIEAKEKRRIESISELCLTLLRERYENPDDSETES